jgi:long-subunit acyl-CoA synthetase (AMP-forming)
MLRFQQDNVRKSSAPKRWLFDQAIKYSRERAKANEFFSFLLFSVPCLHSCCCSSPFACFFFLSLSVLQLMKDTRPQLKRRGQTMTFPASAITGVLDKLVIGKLRAQLFPNMEMAVSGGAPLDAEIMVMRDWSPCWCALCYVIIATSVLH